MQGYTSVITPPFTIKVITSKPVYILFFKHPQFSHQHMHYIAALHCLCELFVTFFPHQLVTLC